MVWTKLIHCDLRKAIRPTLVNGIWQKPLISGRYKAMIKKEFKIAGLPWIYEEPSKKMNPREKAPKPKKALSLRPIRLASIKQALKENEKNEIEYRQNRLDEKRMKGFDLAIDTLMPYKLGALVFSKKVQKKIKADIDEIFDVNAEEIKRLNFDINEDKIQEEKLEDALKAMEND